MPSIHSFAGLRLGCLASLALLASCGTRTGLELPDASSELDAEPPMDARTDAPIDAWVPPDSCVPRVIAVEPITAEVMFVLDRSTSMGWALTGPDGPGPSRWSILVDTLRSELPRYDSTSDMGLLLFPAGDGGASFCDTSPEPQLAPSPDNSSAMLGIVTSTGPGGRTPTADALEVARRWFATHPDPSRVRAAVLATDGAPNCNESLDSFRCPCTGGAGLPTGTCRGDPALCLDDRRSVEMLEGMASEGVPTYVIGIDGDPDPALSAVLSSLAAAGGRPNPLDPARGYYSVRRPEDLAAAFSRIQSSIERCSFAVAAPVPPGREPVLTLDGEIVRHDPTRIEGWEWNEDAEQTIELFGGACIRVQDGTHTLEMTLDCP